MARAFMPGCDERWRATHACTPHRPKRGTALAGDSQQRPAALRWLLLRPRLRARPRQRRHRSVGATRPRPHERLASALLSPRKGIRAEPVCRPG